jgi:hypothetical protein
MNRWALLLTLPGRHFSISLTIKLFDQMMKLNIAKLVMPMLILLFWSCRNENPLPVKQKKANYIIVSSANSLGALSSYDLSKKALSSVKLTTQNTQVVPYAFRTAVRHDKYLYAVDVLGLQLTKINIGNFIAVNVKPVQSERASLGIHLLYDDAHDHLLLAGNNYRTGSSPAEDVFFAFINYYDSNLNLVDKIIIENISSVYDVILDGQVFLISVVDSNQNAFIMAFDLESKALIKKIELESTHSNEFIQTGNHEVMVIDDNLIQSINTASLTISQIAILGSTKENAFSSYAYQADDKKLYYFLATAQPAPVPALLYSYDFQKDEKTRLTDFTSGFVSPPIYYDAENNLILVTNENQLRIFNPDGTLYAETTIEGNDRIVSVIITYD